MIINSKNRSWIVVCLVLLVIATVIYVPYHRGAYNGPSGGSWPGLIYGIIGLALMLFAGLLGARRKVPTWRLGRGASWLRGHIWLGLLSYPIIFFHSGFQFGGSLTLVLMILFTIVVLSGIFGVILQQFLPRMMMTQVPLETIYEQIDSIVEQLRSDADNLVYALSGTVQIPPPAGAAEPRAGGGVARQGEPRPTEPNPRPAPAGPLLGSDTFANIYTGDIRPFLECDLPRNGPLSTPAKANAMFQFLRTSLPAPLHETVSEIESICDERRQLNQQKQLHHWLHGWLLLHVPLSLALLLLAAVHAVMAVRY